MDVTPTQTRKLIRAFPPFSAELQSLAHEVQELLQAKVGTTAYSSVHTSIRQKAAERRNERKTALALQVSSGGGGGGGGRGGRTHTGTAAPFPASLYQ